MKKLFLIFGFMVLISSLARSEGIPECYKHVDQVFWVVRDMDVTIESYKNLGFNQFADLEIVLIESKKSKSTKDIIAAGSPSHPNGQGQPGGRLGKLGTAHYRKFHIS